MSHDDRDLATTLHNARAPIKEVGAGEIGGIAPGATTVVRPRRNSLLDGMSSSKRKEFPVTTGVMDYFRDAILGVAHVSYKGNQKHNPGEDLHWARGKSADDEDAAGRHMMERGDLDPPTGLPVSVQLAWRALAVAQKDLEDMFNIEPPRGCR
jgi:hypothetical protein